jgi:hypothetical protein
MKKKIQNKHHSSSIGSMVLLYMVTWIPSIYPLYVSIYTSTMDPLGSFHIDHIVTVVDVTGVGQPLRMGGDPVQLVGLLRVGEATGAAETSF